MDEKAVRQLLERVMDTDVPPSTVDVARARRTGRRRLRLWRVGIPGASAIAVAAVAALLAGGVLGFGPFTAGGPATGHGSHRPGGSKVSRLISAPAAFNPLVPYATFGWLPAGFSIAGAYGDMMHEMASSVATTYSVPLQAQDPASNRTLGATVGVPGLCRLTGPVAWPPAGLPGRPSSQSVAGPLKPGQRRYPHGLACKYEPGLVALPLTGAAPGIGGARAFWTVNEGLVWEYAPRAWAELFWSTIHGPQPATPSATTRTLMVRVASHVRYGSGARLAFPFRLIGLPAGWHVTQSWLTTSGGRLVGMSLDLGPAADTYALYVAASAAGGPGSCGWVAGQSQHITVGGASGILRTINQPYKHWQTLCSADVRGLAVTVSVDLANPSTRDSPLPGQAALGGALNIFQRHVRLLGPNPANWTTHPLG